MTLTIEPTDVLSLSSCRVRIDALALFVATAMALTLACSGGDSAAPDSAKSQGLVVAMSIPAGAELYAVDPDNGSYSVFLRRRGEESLPSWSPDGKTLYFATDDGDGGSYLVDADGTNVRRIPGAGIGAARWSPDGAWLVTAGSDGSGTAIIAERVDGTERHSLTPGISDVMGGSSWSRDGRLAFARANGTVDGSSIWTMNADGTGLTQVTTGLRDQGPVWSPDGKVIAFTDGAPPGTSSNYEHHVAVVNADGSGRRVLTTSAQSTANVLDAWSPDGRWLLYRRGNIVNGGWSCRYYKVAASGGTPVPLLPIEQPSACFGATWR